MTSLVVPSTPRGAGTPTSTEPPSSAETVALKISYELSESLFDAQGSENDIPPVIRVTYCYPFDTPVQQVKKLFVSHLMAKGLIPSAGTNTATLDNSVLERYRIAIGKELLVDRKSLQENKIDLAGRVFAANLVKIGSQEEEEGDEPVVNASDYVERETVKIKKKQVEVKLRIQEKVGEQLLTCDISCKSNKKFGVISKMYCQHRNYNPEDFVFATSVNHVMLKNDKSLSSMGMSESGNLYVVNVYHKDLVSFK